MTNKTLTLEDLLYFQKTVIAWNGMFGNSVTDKSLIEVYRNLSKEELLGENELVDSYEKGDEEGVIDGLIDSVYTGMYWCCLNGWYVAEEDFFFGGDGWTNERSTKTEDLLKGLQSSLDDKQAFDYQTHLFILLSNLSDKYDLVGAFNRITESNYSKALSKDNKEYTLQECLDSVKEIGRYEDVFVEETGTHYIIKARVDTQENTEYPSGKVVKGVWYKSVESLGGLKEFIK